MSRGAMLAALVGMLAFAPEARAEWTGGRTARSVQDVELRGVVVGSVSVAVLGGGDGVVMLGGSRVRVPVELEVRQSGIGCATVVVQRVDGVTAGRLTLSTPDGHVVELGARGAPLARINDGIQTVSAIAELQLSGAPHAGGASVHLAFEVVPGCGGNT